MESKKINQLATNVAPQSTDLTIIGDPITGVSKKITWLQVSTLIGTAANLQQVTDNGATTTNPIAIGGLTITGLATGVLKSDSGVISSVPFGAANGVATLGGDGKVPSIQLPSYVDDVVEVANFAALPATGETGKIYITLDNNKVYRWTGSTYVEIAANNAVWGAITGTLSNQTDLQNALNAKQNTITLTTTGTSGASTLVGSTLNIPNYSTDLSGYVPYTGATTNVNLGTHSLSAKDLIINHTSGSGVAASITKGGSGEALTVVKSSGSGNAASITGGVTLLDELHLTTDLADAYIASAATWNAKQNAITLTTTGTSGAATLVGATLNIPNYADQFVGTVTSVGLSSATSGVTIGSSPITTSGTITLAIATASGSLNGLLSSTDWTTFNGKQDALNGTGFVKISGTTISYDNSTYLTTSSASSTYLPLTGGTLTGNLTINRGSTSGTGLQVASDNVVITAATGFGSPRQLVFTCGNGPTTTLEAKGFGGNYITDFNIKTYNSSGTAFNVFFGTSAGDVGIGTDTPLSKLQVVATGTILRLGEASGTTGKQLLFGVDSATGRGEIQAVWQGTANTSLVLNLAGGNVGIGVVPSAWGSFTALQLVNGVHLASYTSGVNILDFGINYYFDGTNYIYNNTDAASSLQMRSGEFRFNTAPSGTAGTACTLSERMRITSGGLVGIGNTGIGTVRLAVTGENTSSSNYSFISYDSAGNPILVCRNDRAIFAQGVYNFTTGSGANVVVFSDGSMQRSTSSLKYKKNIENYTKGLAEVMQMRAVTYNSKNEKETQTYAGLIAEEIHDLGLSEFVQYADDGSPDALSYSNMVALLVKAIQEQQAQIEELKAMIAAK
jgi:hypothetical protein